MTVSTSYEVAPENVAFDQGRISRGNIWGVTFDYQAILKSGQRLTLVTHWFVTPIPGWETTDSFGITIDGEPSITLRFAFEDKFASSYDPFHRAAAAMAINMIPVVCAAAPGILRHRPPTTRGPLLAALEQVRS